MSNQANAYTRRGLTEWQRLIEEFEASGLTQQGFCRREGLALSTFQHWKRRVRSRDVAAAEPSPTLIDLGEATVGSGAEPASAWEVELALGGGISLRLRRL